MHFPGGQQSEYDWLHHQNGVRGRHNLSVLDNTELHVPNHSPFSTSGKAKGVGPD